MHRFCVCQIFHFLFVHISKLDHKRVEKVSDVVSVGDEIMVKVIEFDRMGWK